MTPFCPNCGGEHELNNCPVEIALPPPIKKKRRKPRK